MSINKRLIFSSMFNHTWPKYLNENLRQFSPNQSTNHISSDRIFSKNSWIFHRFTIVQRTIFILSLIVLFWIIFIIIYMSSRLIMRFLSNFKQFRYFSEFSSTSNEKICRAFVISSNHYGSFRPTYHPSPLLYRSDSLFSQQDFLSKTEPTTTTSEQSLQTISQLKPTNTSLLEHYLKTYNPLKLDLTNGNEGTVITSIVRDRSYEEALSDTDTRPLTNCYALHCTNKQKFHHGERYVRLEEQENYSTTRSLVDDRLSSCSTKLTSITLPILMVTDCSDSQRLHTDIIELNEDEKDKD